MVDEQLVQSDQFDSDQQVRRRPPTRTTSSAKSPRRGDEPGEIEATTTYTVLTYSDRFARDGARAVGPDDSWISVPQTVTVYAGKGSAQRMKHRNGGPDLCGNSVPIRLAELVAEDPVCGDLYAITEMSFYDLGQLQRGCLAGERSADRLRRVPARQRSTPPTSPSKDARR